MRIYGRAFREARAWWPRIGVATLLGLAATPIALLVPLPLKIAVDSAIEGAPLPWPLAVGLPEVTQETALMLAVLLSIGLAALQAGWSLLDWLYREWLSERMIIGFRGRLFLHGFGLPLAQSQGGSDAIQRIYSDAPALVWTTLYGPLPLITATAALIGAFVVTATISAPLALIAVLTALPAIALIHARQRQLREGWHGAREAESASLALVQEGYGAQRVVTTYGQEHREQARFLAAAAASMRKRLQMMAREGLLNLAFGISVALGMGAILHVGVSEVIAGTTTTGDLLLIMGYAAQLYGPMQQIGGHFAGQQRALASAERAFAFLDRVPTVADRDDAVPLPRARGAISLRGVGFAHAGNPPVLRDVSLEIAAGSCIGIKGRTGAGKTTLIDLIIRQLDPTSGQVLLDGRDLRDYRLADLRNQFAVVSQEPVLFATSIAENIAYGVRDASLEAIVAAAEAANAHGFVSALPQGYTTRLGERGLTLSGGERQRLALARAFLKDSPVLILDEPTSAVDTATEAAIIQAIERLMQGRTTLIIAHRLATLQRADRVLAVADGSVHEVADVREQCVAA